MYGYDDLAELMDRALLLEEKNVAYAKKSDLVKEKANWRGNNSKFNSTWEKPKDTKDGGKSNLNSVEKS